MVGIPTIMNWESFLFHVRDWVRDRVIEGWGIEKGGDITQLVGDGRL